MASSRRNVALSALLAGSALLLLPLGAAAADQAVSISGFAFHPQTITVTEGDTVTWTNSDSVNHTATSDDGTTFKTGPIGPGGSATVAFGVGTYAYHCDIHPTMRGTVVVRAESAGGGGVPGTDTVPLAPPSDSLAGFALMLGAAAGGLIGLRPVRRRTRSR
jgi:plastocyanin